MVLSTRLSWKITAFTAFSTLLFIGCATDNASNSAEQDSATSPSGQWQLIQSNSSRPAAIKFFGFLDVTQDEDGESQYFEAGFAQFDETAPLSVLLDSFKQPDLDSCDYRQQERGDSTPMEFADELELPGYPYEFVSVGSKIDVSVGNRRYAKLVRTSSNPEDAVQYETDVGSLPLSFGGFKFGDVLLRTRGLKFATAGDVFPAFSGIEVPPIDSMASFKLSSRQRVAKTTKFRWRPGRNANDPGVRVQIEAGGGGRAIFCAVADDGEFQLPNEVKLQLLDASIPNPSSYRDAIWFYLHENALLIVSQSSYY